MMRLDTAIVDRGLASGREKAKELIAAGLVLVNGIPAKKASVAVAEEDLVEITASLHRYVGRGGEKLDKILAMTQWDLTGAVCIDIGASTGGFTDCLLQHHAAKVYALDVGRGQLHPRLREDRRVINMEATDVRHTADILSVIGKERPSFGVMDVSFVSIASLWSSVELLLSQDACMVCLIKPQFEAGRAAVGKKGVVKDPKEHCQVLQSLLSFWQERGWTVSHLTFSPITGGEGNIEYLAVLCQNSYYPFWQGDIKGLVKEAFFLLRK